jgi:hypothetical protein
VSQRTQRAERITLYHKAITKPYPTISFPYHTLYSREKPRPLVTASSAIVIVVHFAKVPKSSDLLAVQATREPPFYHSLHFLWCMAQISLHVITKVYYGSYARLS